MLPSPEPARAFASIAAEGLTHTAVVPAVAARWLDHAAEHKIGPVLGTTLQQVFGMAEGLLNFTRLDDRDEVICTAQGRPLSPADEVRLVDPFDVDVLPGEPGSLLTRGPYTPRRYYRAAEQNARAFTADGWYRSGDICRMMRDGNLVVEGRDKDMINRGSEKISAEEVENVVYQLPGVQQVLVDELKSTKVGKIDKKALRADIAARLAHDVKA